MPDPDFSGGGGDIATVSTADIVRPIRRPKIGYYNPVTGLTTEEGTPYRQQIPLSELKSLPDQYYAAGNLAELETLADLVKKAGFDSWDEALAAASMDPNKEQRSWREYLTERAKTPELWKEFNDRNGKGSGGAFSSTSTSVNLSSRSQAGSIADENFKQQLGRTASRQEIIDFQQALNEQQKKNPNVTKTSGYSSGGSSTSSTTSSGGFDYTRFARQYAQSQPGFQERYAAVKFMDILDSAISDPNSLDALIGGN